jgi:hypothetical protein
MHTVEFESWGQLIEFIKTPTVNPVCSQSQSKGMHDWYGTHDFNEAVATMEHGWAEGLDKVKRLSDALVNTVSNLIEIPEIRYEVEGMDFDIASVLRNEPESWYRFENETRENENHKQLKIVYNVSTSSGISKDMMTARGAAVCALIELLEMAGYRLELWVNWTTQADDTFNANVLVKSYSQPLDMARVAFAMAHASMLRRIMFNVVEHYPKTHKAIGGMMYGIPCEAEAAHKGDIYLGCMLYGDGPWLDRNETLAWVKDTLKAQGVHIKEQVS